MRSVCREPVGHVDHRGRHLREAAALLEPQWRAGESALAERDTGRAERPGQDDEISGVRTRAPGHAIGATERRHAHEHGARTRRVAPAHRHARLGQALVQLHDVLDARSAGHAERDDQRKRLRTRCREIAEIGGGGAKAELAPREQVEAEMHTLDERILRDDEASDLRGVVLDALYEPPALELGEERELANLVEPHSSAMLVRPSSSAGSSA